MPNAESIRVECDDRGFELHIDTTEHGTVVFNVQACAEELFDAVRRQIRPWLAERDEAAANYHQHDPYADDDSGPWPGESVQAYYARTGQDGPLREVADILNKARRENP